MNTQCERCLWRDKGSDDESCFKDENPESTNNLCEYFTSLDEHIDEQICYDYEQFRAEWEEYIKDFN